MIKTNFNAIPEDLFGNYLNFLVSKFFKILPLYESESITLKSYLSSLMIELTGNKDFIIQLKYDPNFLTLIGTIQYLIDNQYTHNECKREVFKCIKIVEKLKENYQTSSSNKVVNENG